MVHSQIYTGFIILCYPLFRRPAVLSMNTVVIELTFDELFSYTKTARLARWLDELLYGDQHHNKAVLVIILTYQTNGSIVDNLLLYMSGLHDRLLHLLDYKLNLLRRKLWGKLLNNFQHVVRCVLIEHFSDQAHIRKQCIHRF